jgi:hypothetical protein
MIRIGMVAVDCALMAVIWIYSGEAWPGQADVLLNSATSAVLVVLLKKCFWDDKATPKLTK